MADQAKINRPLIERIIDTLQGLLYESTGHEIGFCMATIRDEGGTWPDLSGNDCGTVLCLHGWARYLTGDTSWPGHSTGLDEGLSVAEYDDLIMPIGWVSGEPYSVEEAIGVLQLLLATGIVDWTAVRHLRPARLEGCRLLRYVGLVPGHAFDGQRPPEA